MPYRLNPFTRRFENGHNPVTIGTNTASALSLAGQALSIGDVFVQLAGDTMTGPLVINNTGSPALTINTDGLIVDGVSDRVAIGRTLVTGRTLAVGGPTDIYGETNIIVAGDNAGAFKAYLAGEGAARFQFTNKGDVQWGPGTGGADTTLIRRASNRLQTYGDMWFGPYDGQTVKVNGVTGFIAIKDGISEPTTDAGFGSIYIDSADGDLKIKYGDGTVKLIVVDT